MWVGGFECVRDVLQRESGYGVRGRFSGGSRCIGNSWCFEDSCSILDAKDVTHL